ncbi:MAG: hypothetical protein AAFY84_11085 [Pseudomonadota bacterium]
MKILKPLIGIISIVFCSPVSAALIETQGSGQISESGVAGEFGGPFEFSFLIDTSRIGIFDNGEAGTANLVYGDAIIGFSSSHSLFNSDERYEFSGDSGSIILQDGDVGSVSNPGPNLLGNTNRDILAFAAYGPDQLGVPDRDDFDITSGDIEGEPLTSAVLLLSGFNPSQEFISLAETPGDLIDTLSAGLGDELRVTFLLGFGDPNALDFIFGTNSSVDDLRFHAVDAFPPSEVPIPGALPLMASALALGATALRRRKMKTQ